MYVNPEFQLLKSVQLVWFFSVWAKFASSDIMILMFGFLFSIHIVFSENRVGHREWNVNVCFFLVWYCKRWKKKQEWCKCRLNIYAQKDFLFARNAEKSAPPQAFPASFDFGVKIVKCDWYWDNSKRVRLNPKLIKKMMKNWNE